MDKPESVFDQLFKSGEESVEEPEKETLTEAEEEEIVEEEKEVAEEEVAPQETDADNEEESEEEATSDLEIYNEILVNSGFSIPQDEDEKDSTYVELINELQETEDQVEGVSKLTKYIANKTVESKFSELQEQYPEAFNFLNYQMNGGNISDLLEVYTETEPELKKDDNVLLTSYMRKGYEEKGYDKDVIDTVIEKFKAEDKLYDKAKELKKEREAAREEAKKAKLEEQAANRKAVEEATNEMAASISEQVNKGRFETSVGNIKLPAKYKKPIYEEIMNNSFFDPNSGKAIMNIEFDANELGRVINMLLLDKAGSEYLNSVNESNTNKSRKLKRKSKTKKKSDKEQSSIFDDIFN